MSSISSKRISSLKKI